MNRRTRQTLFIAAPLLLGIALLTLTIARTDPGPFAALARRVGLALPLALLPSAAWHLLRTVAWQRCFPSGVRPSLARAFRIRLAAEAFSFVTISGLAGDPLKVVLLQHEVAPSIGAAAVALERILYLCVTIAIVSIAATVTMLVLPLSRVWMYVFAAVAVVPPLLVLLAALLVRRRRRRAARREASGDAPPPSRVLRFIREVDTRLREAVRGNPRGVSIVVMLEAASYAMMALEVWLALRLTGSPITMARAFAVETFTRTTSMASVFIPANIGALEASNVAGAAAVHASIAGGLALAIVRRLRGLIWCAAGFLVYPRKGAARSGSATPQHGASDHRPEPPLAIVDNAAAGTSLDDVLGGLPLGERIVRAAARAGYTRLRIWSPARSCDWARAARRFRRHVDVVVDADFTTWQARLATLDATEPLTLVAPGIVASPALLGGARGVSIPLDRPFAEVPGDMAGGGSGVFRVRARDLASADAVAAIAATRGAMADDSARTAASLRVGTRAELAESERRLRASIFKSTDGLLARFNRRMSIPISVVLIRTTRLSANVMSAAIILLGGWSGWLFSRGDYVNGVLAALVSWAASVLDGCDGELARLQYSESAFGCWFDTIGDYAYYVAVFAGLTVGAVHQTGWQGFWWVGASMCVGMVLTFALLILLRGRITEGRPEQLRENTKAHFYGSGKRWAWLVAKLSNCATRATMPYGIVAFALVDGLPVVLVLGAIGAQVYWISLAIELRKLLDASSRRVREREEREAVAERRPALSARL